MCPPQASDDRKRGALPSSVRTQKPVDHTRLKAQVDASKHFAITKIQSQSPDLNHAHPQDRGLRPSEATALRWGRDLMLPCVEPEKIGQVGGNLSMAWVPKPELL